MRLTINEAATTTHPQPPSGALGSQNWPRLELSSELLELDVEMDGLLGCNSSCLLNCTRCVASLSSLGGLPLKTPVACFDRLLLLFAELLGCSSSRLASSRICRPDSATGLVSLSRICDVSGSTSSSSSGCEIVDVQWLLLIPVAVDNLISSPLNLVQSAIMNSTRINSAIGRPLRRSTKSCSRFQIALDTYN